jgi:dinuclear metal center YbgI/SA1388 family protein
VGKILDLIDELAPWRLAEEWDNSGLQVGRKEAPAQRIALALDPSLPAIEAARQAGAHVLLTHHPLIFKPLKSLDLDEPAAAAVGLALQSGLTVISAHTNLDVALGGVGWTLAGRLGLSEVEPLEPMAATGPGPGAAFGFGIVGHLEKDLTFAELIEFVKQKLELKGVRTAARPRNTVRKIALMPGSGGGFVGQAKRKGAEVLLTGDVSHHQARDAEFLGLGLIDAGHFATERPVLKTLAERLEQAAARRGEIIETIILDFEDDPWLFEEELS